ncbi:L-rhamnose mutarotase [Rathayibacter oskolensis]|uniref:L-rhamnose mutarotase n=1 Tax=Rathayibacter oskolensis TaxID=1891671 RepID=A0A1X7P3M6_9MICO|nr:L-rhamnose mutarotase [Rathayibacter oskolensis]SMH44408.1 L-rhamnose mutarotase [Rathayibacter oskolensis]
MTQRVCFTMQLKKDRIADYLAAHETVWPEMREALRETGWSDYSLFIRESDGLIVGYLETDDFELARARMAEKEVNTRWQDTMAEYFDDSGHPDRSMVRLEEYFHLE